MTKNPVRAVNFNDYAFVFCGGTCGSFIKLIWYHYICNINQHANLVGLTLNCLTGDAHDTKLVKHYHNVGDIITLKKNKPNIKIVLIVFDEDDIELIVKMQYFKHTKSWLETNLEFAIKEWPELTTGISDRVTRQNTWQEFLAVGYKSWLEEIEINYADFILDFKTIYGKSNKNLNQTIANFFKVSPLLEIDNYINQYRAVNYGIYGQ